MAFKKLNRSLTFADLALKDSIQLNIPNGICYAISPDKWIKTDA